MRSLSTFVPAAVLILLVGCSAEEQADTARNPERTGIEQQMTPETASLPTLSSNSGSDAASAPANTVADAADGGVGSVSTSVLDSQASVQAEELIGEPGFRPTEQLATEINEREEEADAVVEVELPNGQGARDTGDNEPSNIDRPKSYRTWSDRTGSYSVEAALIGQLAGIVRLERKNGEVVEVPIERLSKEDIEFVMQQVGEVAAIIAANLIDLETASELEKVAARQRTAERALALYELFLLDPDVPLQEKTAARKRLSFWQDAANRKLVRLGNDWMAHEEAERIRKEEQDLIVQAHQLFNVGNLELAEKKFLEASRTNPEGIHADFRLGILCALLGRNAEKAERHFDKCVKRRLPLKPELRDIEKVNLISALNNLAVAKLRQRHVVSALNYWKEALAIGPPSAEIIQNLGRIGYLSGIGAAGPKDAIRLGAHEQAMFEELYAQALGSQGDQAFDPATGWLYMPFVPELEEEPDETVVVSSAASASPIESTLRVVGYGTGFMVSPGYILTNAHVADSADAFYILEHGRPSERLIGTLHAISDQPDSLDLALIHCEQAQAPPLRFRDEPIRQGAELRMLGFPLPDTLGSSLKVTRGSVTALPPHNGLPASLADIRNYLLYDGIINPGNSGGPACDANGAVVCVNTAVTTLADAFGGNYAAGVTAQQALEFLDKKLPNYAVPEPISGAFASWEDAVEHVAQSTVQILILCDAERIQLDEESARVRQQKASWKAYEDPWCMACHGRGLGKCPVRDCANGGVRTYRFDKIRTPDGHVITRRIPTRKKCETCSGRGSVDCGYCSNGIDPSVL